MGDNPKLDFKPNVPVTFKILKHFKDGESQYGKWYGYEVDVDGTPHTMFAKEALYSKIKGLPEGATVTACLVTEKDPETGRPKSYWKVNSGDHFDTKGDYVVKKESVKVDEDGYMKDREVYETFLYDALSDAHRTMEKFCLDFELDFTKMFAPGDVTKIAISRMIDLGRK